MRITVASGKGGTGKTTVATSLARVLAGARAGVTYADCDVEEPNGEIFLKPRIEKTETVLVRVPTVEHELCTSCGDCSRACQFHAILVARDRVTLFPELCHGCGSCALACGTGAITETTRAVGTLSIGAADGVRFVAGALNVGEPSATPVIRAVKDRIRAGETVIADAPPGTACPAVETLRGSDLAVLVTEPTPFGLHDLTLAVATVRQLGLATGIVINRSDVGDDSVRAYCGREGLVILTEIPNRRDIAEAYARGEMPMDVVPAFADAMQELAEAVAARDA
jgi:MinD superfamily P-loop ATPase